MRHCKYDSTYITKNNIEGVEYNKLADTVGTPCYIYSANQIKDDLRQLKAVLPPELHFFYSLKANPNLSLVSLIHQQQVGCEVCSLPELETALTAGVQPDDIIFVGPAKSYAELRRSVELGIHAVVVESRHELEMLNQIAAEQGKRQRFALRINPDFAPAKARLVMSGKPRQFGLDESQALSLMAQRHAYPHLRLCGIHIYLGTRILDAQAIAHNTLNILRTAEKCQQETGVELEFVDIGGGLGIAYYEKETPLDLALLGRLLQEPISRFQQHYPRVKLVMELGRFIVARSGVFLTRVRYVKSSRDKRFAICDGGSNCHGAAAGLGAVIRKNFPTERLGAEQPGVALQRYDLTGPLCTPTDIIGENVLLPTLEVGDLIGLFNSGAYGPTASPVYFLSFGYPAEVLVDGDRAVMIRRPDDMAHLLRQQQAEPVLLSPSLEKQRA
ncbi:diaminopimelate decarboxylase [Lonsdalea populi]|uniref:diaminopimelate decarboxylase n=1 Tax=Lonsdalea populi TaxID=1172565 RepID=UPI000A260DE7|nr:diaminopimelate decarboxylase [Lonsdalea populi]OSM95641.1 diaminopimelate decarboxylase [Lonsdalea populi]RAT72146.1 diaminopimelate decarboxylase [Lonsdalea populi]RAT73404.1 diaminopimelate decarboxylase [Lonsdalea populi]RAT76983.1 diaminopimelate decarboxylase [Lonsdalea populi]RAT77509.1 diaminopimelate decarboxylase [Lonsdalea populi]